MNKKMTMVMLMGCFVSTHLWAQSRSVSGRVLSQSKVPVSGATIQVKGSGTSVITDAEGNFSIMAAPSDSLVIQSIGYAPFTVFSGSTDLMLIQLREQSTDLNEVVVTALGIKRNSKDLTYAAQTVGNAELTTVKDPSFINSLSGKVAGVTITKSASGLGGSTRVILRGNKSTRENQPLYVIDGIPMANYNAGQPGEIWGSTSGSGSTGRDGGDGISNLNPDDIESVTVLKGASGAALYGSAAANGAIVITTKSGKAGRTRVSVSSDLTLENPLYYPEAQFKYGQTGLGTSGYDQTAIDSWGGVVNAPDHIKDFFQTGVSTIDGVSLTSGTEKAQTYLSYGYTGSKGIMPTSTFKRHNLNLRQTAKFFNNKLTVDGNVLLLSQTAHNRPSAGLYANPLVGLYIFPRGLDFNSYKNNYEYASAARNGLMLQNWFDINYDNGMSGQDFEQNPYWILNKMPREDSRSRAYTTLSLRYQINDWLNVQARGSYDKTIDEYDSKMYAGTQSVQASSNGRYTYQHTDYTQKYADLLLMGNKDLSSDFSLQGTIGTSIIDTKVKDMFFDANPQIDPSLLYVNKFGINYIAPSGLVATQSFTHKQLQALFGTFQLAYKKYLYLDVTARNDWSSTFAFTPTKNKGYFYYSTGLNFVLSDAVQLPSAVSFAKFRASYARVGNDVPVYSTNPADYTIDNQLGAQINTKAPYPGTYLKPEDNRSMEFGTEWRFWNNRVGFDLTYYKNNNYRQYIEVSAPLGSGYSTYYLNLGNIENHGIEGIVFVDPVKTSSFHWNSSVNFAANSNKVKSLSDADIAGANAGNAFIITGIGVNMYQSQIMEGGSWGDIYGYAFDRASDGSILVTDDGAPIKAASIQKIGNSNPKFTLGWSNKFDYKSFTFSFLVDGRFGGQVMSVTQAVMDQYGASKASAEARDAGGVNVKATKASDNTAWSGLLPADVYYKAVGGRSGLSENYIYSATAVRMREIALGYKLPIVLKGVSDVRFSLIGRNLFFFSKKAPFDPEVSMATSNALQGVDAFGIPSTRSIGASLRVSF